MTLSNTRRKLCSVIATAAATALFLAAAAEKAHADPISYPFGTVQNESYGSGAARAGFAPQPPSSTA